MTEKEEQTLVNWLEESVLSYAARKKLPAKSFCGPNRSYPAHDRRHAANCLARARQSLKRGKLSRAQYNRIVACCRRKLKQFGGTPATEETMPENIDWLIQKREID